MHVFEPFCGVRYDDPRPDAPEGVLDLEGAVAPYVAAADPQAFATFTEEMNQYNVTRLIQDPSLWNQWLKAGALSMDEENAFYICRIGYRNTENQLLQVSGVFGAMKNVAPPLDSSPADVVPMLFSINAPGFSDLLMPTDLPIERATDTQGAHHRLWATRQMGVVSAITDAVNSADLDVPAGSGTRLAFITETLTSSALPALGMVFRPR